MHALGRRQLDGLRRRPADTLESVLSNLGVGLHISLGKKLVDNLGRLLNSLSKGLGDALETSMLNGLREYLSSSLGEKAMHALSRRLLNGLGRLQVSLRNRLVDNLRRPVNCLRKSLRSSLRRNLLNGLRNILVSYVFVGLLGLGNRVLNVISIVKQLDERSLRKLYLCRVGFLRGTANLL
jgi:hypothetical protein